MKVTLDKIASTTRNARIPREVLLSDEIPAQEGMVLAVRVHGTKTVYNTLEDVHGRMIGLNDGDIIAAVLGARRALRGYAGHVPETVKVGDRLDILNLGGVVGRCTSVNLEIGKPLQAEVLGQILSFPHLGERVGVPASIRTGAVAWSDRLEKSAPIVYMAGTCMNAGKTFACGEIIRYLARKGYRVCGAKLTGVSLMRDTMSMVDRGAVKSMSFTDLGVVSTTGAVSVPVAKGLINALNKEEPDCLVIELGDGILGEYGVQEILHDAELMQAASMHIMCANDPVSAWGAVELFNTRFKRKVDLICGPATDNAVGKEFIEGQIGVRALNARIEYEDLGRFVEQAVFAGVPA
ncbi:MAG: hypothetical protein A2V88_14085 [Elusimicrobia bacterium RBG_16_66_12]|nr:MAG: hypothetical protein A2V88_14085 [Elusimicrobia bacterium RBG_16_66_12]